MCICVSQGTFLVMQAGGRHMKEADMKDGSIITMSSISCKVPGTHAVLTFKSFDSVNFKMARVSRY